MEVVLFLSLSITAGLYFSTFSQFLFCSLCGTAFPADRQSMEPQRSRCATVAATSSQLTCASSASGNVQNGCWTDLLFAKMYFPREGRCIQTWRTTRIGHTFVDRRFGRPFWTGHASAAWARFGEVFCGNCLASCARTHQPSTVERTRLGLFFKIDGLVQVYKLRFWKSYFVEPRDLAHFIWSVTSSGVMDTHNTSS